MNRRDLIKAIETGDLTRVNLWLNQPKVDIDAPLASKQKSALLHAADRGQPAIVKLLLERGANVDRVDTGQQTASHLAAATGKVAVLAELQAHGADWSSVDYLGLSPLDLAAMAGMEVSVVFLVRAGAPFVYPFAKQRAASISVAVLQAMLDRGMSNSLRKLPVLHEVIGKKSLNIPLFCMLVAVCQVDVDRRDLRDRTALYTAVSDNPLLGVNLLLAAGADPNAEGDTETIFVEAMRYYEQERSLMRRLPQIRAFIACGGNLDAVQPILTRNNVVIKPASMKKAQQVLALDRLALVRDRALAVCIGLQSLRIDALQMCEILQYACGPIAQFIPFHQWWRIVTTVKHHHR